MDSLLDLYRCHTDQIDGLLALAIFLGLARIAFWSPRCGFRLSGPLVVGLTGMLSLSLLLWAEKTGHSLIELGPLAALAVAGAVVIMLLNAATNSRA